MFYIHLNDVLNNPKKFQLWSMLEVTVLLMDLETISDFAARVLTWR